MKTANIKSLFLSVCTILSGALFWYLYATAVQSAAKEIPVGPTLVFLGIYLICLCLGLLLYRTNLLFLGTFFLSLLPLLLFVQLSWIYFAAIALLVFAGARSFLRVKREISHRTDFYVPELLRRGLPFLLTFLSIMIALVYYMEAGRTADITTQSLLSRSAYDRLISLAHPSFLNRVLPGFEPESTVDEYITMRLLEEDLDINALTSRERETLLTEARGQFSKELAINISGSEKLKDVLYNLIVAKGEVYVESYKSFVPFAFALGFFLFLRAIAYPFGMLIMFISWGIMRVLLYFHIVEKQQETTVQEKIAWS